MVHARREDARYRDGEARLPEAEDQDSRQRQLTRMGNAAAGVGLARLMGGDTEEAREWFTRAAERYRESYELAPPGSWGRPIAILKARILAGDWDGAESDAQWTLEQDAVDAESPIGRYAATLALLVLGRDEEARVLADGLRSRDDFPAPAGAALVSIAAREPLGYIEAIEALLQSFETRENYLEDLPAADTVVVLQALAARRGMAAGLSSPLLPRS
jgi:tetratricopeptide (TPR) repeat protein